MHTHPDLINKAKESLNFSEVLWHRDVPAFSITAKLLKMKNKPKSHFDLFLL